MLKYNIQLANRAKPITNQRIIIYNIYAVKQKSKSQQKIKIIIYENIKLSLQKTSKE